MRAAHVNRREACGDIRYELVGGTDPFDKLRRPAAAQPSGCRDSVSDEGVETGDEIGSDRVQVTRLIAQHFLGTAPREELRSRPGIFESDFGDSKIQAIVLDTMADVWRWWRGIGIVIGLRKVKFPLLDRWIGRQADADILKPTVGVGSRRAVHVNVDAVEPIGAISNGVFFAVDHRQRAGRQEVGDRLTEQVALVGIEDGARLPKSCCPSLEAKPSSAEPSRTALIRRTPWAIGHRLAV